MAYEQNGQTRWRELNGVKGVYFVRDGLLVKIGWSGDVGKRLRSLEPAMSGEDAIGYLDD